MNRFFYFFLLLGIISCSLIFAKVSLPDSFVVVRENDKLFRIYSDDKQVAEISITKGDLLLRMLLESCS